jgi:hypothetical protein
MVFGDALTMDPDGKPLNKLAFGDWGLSELMHFRVICQPAVFMRRSALEQVGYLNESFHFMLDHYLWLRIASEAPIKHIPRLWAAARHHMAAKNVSLAPKFSMEIYRMVDWMLLRPEFAPQMEADNRRIWGGAHRLAARYYLEGGQNMDALKAYGKSLVYWPSYALQHWHRMAFVIASLVGVGKFVDATRFARRQPPKLEDDQFQNWPGLNLQT